jgi:HD-like signal output (HDOD) protein
MTEMRKILFVDDEEKVLEGLQRMLRPMRHEWDMSFALSGKAALETLDSSPFDVVVSDMRMPVMDGAQLLAEVSTRYPQIVRIVLSGYSNQEMIMKSVGPAHQYLSKPCTTEALKETIGRAFALHNILDKEPLQKLISKMDALPSLPSLYTELMSELQSPDASLDRIGEIISKDIGMTAKVLQMVNSAFFGLRRTISNPREAVQFLGTATVASLALTVHIFSEVKTDASLPSSYLKNLWTHSMKVGLMAKAIAKKQDNPNKCAESALTAGLLHDSGKVVLLSSLPNEYSEMLHLVQRENMSCVSAELEIFGATHAEVGGYLLGLWGLPSAIVEAVAFHHQPSEAPCNEFNVLTAIHVADAFDQRSVANDESKERVAKNDRHLDEGYLTKLNLLEQAPVWKELFCGA